MADMQHIVSHITHKALILRHWEIVSRLSFIESLSQTHFFRYKRQANCSGNGAEFHPSKQFHVFRLPHGYNLLATQIILSTLVQVEFLVFQNGFHGLDRFRQFLRFLKYYPTFKVRKFESLFYKVKTFLQKSTASTGLQAE